MNVKDVIYFNRSDISNSDLGVLRDSPWYFRQYKDKKIEKVTVDHFELGSLIHLAILEPDLFVVSEVDKPSGLMGKFIDLYVENGLTSDAAKTAHLKSGFKYSLATVMNKLESDKSNKKYLDFIKDNNDKLVLTKSHKYIISQVEKGIQRNPSAYDFLFSKYSDDSEEYNELELYGELDGVKIKGKIDKLIIDHINKKIILNDLKSTSSAPYFRVKKVQNTGELTIDYQGTGFFNSFKTYSYYRQMAFYKTLIAINYPELFKEYSFECYIVAVNTTQSFDCSVIKVREEWLEYGRLEMEELLFRYKEHVREDQWCYPILDTNKGLIIL